MRDGRRRLHRVVDRQAPARARLHRPRHPPRPRLVCCCYCLLLHPFMSILGILLALFSPQKDLLETLASFIKTASKCDWSLKRARNGNSEVELVQGRVWLM